MKTGNNAQGQGHGRELSLVEKISRAAGKAPAHVLVGIGDDAAVLERPAAPLVVTVDMLVEGVHFDRAWATPEQIGWKALAVNLSDVAAMGAEPRYVLVSLGLPTPVDESWVEKLYAGMRKLADPHGVAIVGGNVTRTPTVVIDVVVLADATPGAPFLRSTATPGDLVVVTGELGAARAGLECLRAGRKTPDAVIARQLTPTPRLPESRALRAAGGVTAMLDVSDGLASELWHLAEASNVAILVDKPVPVPTDVAAVAKDLGGEADRWVWEGGEDYELLFTWSPSVPLPKLPLTVIGRVEAGEISVRCGNRGVARVGWDPFT